MRSVVTGGAGFIGSHLCDALLERGDNVWCADNLYLGKKKNIDHLSFEERFHFVLCDVTKPDELDALFEESRPEIVYHLAANSDIQAGSNDHTIDLRLNFISTYEVLEAMNRFGCKKIFFASTSAVFGETEGRLSEEYGPLRPISFYGASKLAAESYISVFVDNYGFQAWILRFPNVVGERATHGAVYDFIMKLGKDPHRLVVLGDGTQTKPYLYVKDLVDAILLVVEKASEPLAVYHVGNETITSVKEMAEIVIEEMGVDAFIEYTGGSKGWVGDVNRFEYHISKIKSLGWAPSCTSSEAVRLSVRKILGKE